jgi:hypothetical protein
MTDRNLNELLNAWMDLGPTAAPGRVADAARLEARTTHQTAIPMWWPPRRFPVMNIYAKVALATAAVVAAALIGYSYLVAPNVGGPPTPAPSPSATPAPLEDGALEPGRYAITDVIPSTIVITVPPGWLKNVVPAAVWTAGSDAHLAFATVDNVYVDPCAPAPVLSDPPIGSTVDDLVAALQRLPGFEVTAPADVTVGGYEGNVLELTAPAECDPSRLWHVLPANEDAPVEPHARIWILDASGTRLVITAHDRPTALASDVDEMRQMVETLELAP